MLVHPIKPTSKAPGIKLLKLKYATPLSDFAFELNLRRYSMELDGDVTLECRDCNGEFLFCVVGQCRLTLSNPS